MSINTAPIYDWQAWIDLAPDFDWSKLGVGAGPGSPPDLGPDRSTAPFKWSGDNVGGFDHEATAFAPQFVYDASGTRARLRYDAPSGAPLMGKSPIPALPSACLRFSLELTGYPEWGLPIVTPLTGAGASAWRLRVGSAGQLILDDSANALAATTAPIPLGQEVRVEVSITPTAGAVRIYASRKSDELLSEATGPGAFSALTNLRIGRSLSTPPMAPCYFDDILLLGSAEWIGPPVDPPAVSSAHDRVGIIGDSLTAMSGANGSHLHAALLAGGFPTRNVYHWGVGGKKIAAADLTGKAASHNIDDAVAQLGGVDHWVIALGTNDRPSDDATVSAAINSTLAKIDAVTPGAKVTWIGLSSLETASADDVRVNGLIQAALAARPNSELADWDAHIRAADGGANPSPLWQADGVHMTPAGYEIRAAFYASFIKEGA